MPASSPATRTLLREIYDAAVRAAQPASFLAARLPPPPPGRLVLLAAGKAAASMTAEAERHYLAQGLPRDRLVGLAVTRRGYAGPTGVIDVVEAGHPVPDATGLAATERVLTLARAAGPDDLVLVLLSGGGSANWIAPASGVTLAEKQALTRSLLRSGATILEINTVRRHLSRIKGGRLAAAAAPAPVLTLAISDVPGDAPEAIASGPTVPDASTLADARAVLGRFGITPPASIAAALADSANETPKPDDPAFRAARFEIVARPADALAAAARRVREAGYEVVDLGPDVEGEAREVAARHAAIALDANQNSRKVAVISGGELTVTIRGDGRGGPNQEYALALALALGGAAGISAVAGDTDGTDGGGGAVSDPAGAFVDASTLARAAARGLDAGALLARNDSTTFFECIGDLLAPGPTLTNVNDLRAILIGG